MNDASDGPKRPEEMPAVKTTIVGGRPPGCGQPIGPIPRGLEILLKKAAVDPEFKAMLLAKRAAAAVELGLVLERAEAAMLDSVPADQLALIIANTKVSDETRRTLLGKLTAASLAALGSAAVISAVCLPTLGHTARTLGIEPDYPPQSAGSRPIPEESPATQPEATSSDTPPHPDAPATQPDTAPTVYPGSKVSRGIRPDRPGRRGE